jgi:precorrin-4 methylase
MKYTKSLLFLAVTTVGSYGAIYDQVTQLPTYTYDYIIVGGVSNDEPHCYLKTDL